MSLNISPTSTATEAGPLAVQKRQARDARGRITKVNSVIKAASVPRRFHAPTRYTQDLSTVPSTLFTSGAKGTGRLELGAFTVCKGLTLKYTVTRAAGGVMAPAWAHWEKIVFRGSGGSTHLCTLYPETMGFFLNADYNKTQQDAGILALCGADANWAGVTHAAAGTTTYHLPICRSFLQDFFCDEDAAQGVLIDFYSASGGICHDGATRVACTLDNMAFVIDSNHVSAQDRGQLVALNKSNIMSAIWPEALKIDFNARSLQPGSACRLDLDNINAESVVALLVYVRAQGTVGAARTQYVSLGADCRVDIKTSSGVSRYGSGSPSTLDYQSNKIFPEHFPSDYAKRNAVVFIPQCADVRAALHGIRSGGARKYSGDRDYIELTPDASFGGGNFEVCVYAICQKQIHKRNSHLAVEG